MIKLIAQLTVIILLYSYMVQTFTSEIKSKVVLVILFIIYLNFSHIHCQAQQFEWVQKQLITANGYRPFLSIDNQGNSFLLTSFYDSVTVGNKTYKAVRKDFIDIVLIKYDKDGNIAWSNFISTIYQDFTTQIASDKEGNTYIILSPHTDITINNKVFSISQDTFAYHLIKFDPQGNVLSYKPLYNLLHGMMGRIYIDSESNVYITGWFSQSTTFDGVTVRYDAYASSYIAKYNKEGKLQWIKQNGGSGYPNLTVDFHGNVYVTSFFNGYATFGNTTLQIKRPLNYDVYDSYICKYDRNGNVLWVTHIDQSTKAVYTSSISVDITGKIYVTGMFLGQLIINKDTLIAKTIQEETNNILFAQYNADGKPVYGKNLGFTSNYNGNYVFADGSEDVYWSGSGIFQEKVEDNKIQLKDIHVIRKLSRTGDLKWTKYLDGTSGGISNSAADSKGNVYSTGFLFKNAVFDKDTLKDVEDYSHLFMSKLADTTFVANPILNTVSGKVFHDKNANCKWDTEEEVLAGQIIKAEPGPYYSSTDSSGNFKLYVDKGTYILTQVLHADEISRQTKQLCPNPSSPYSITFNSYGKDTSGFDFGNQVTTQPLLKVEVAADRHRRCFRNQTTIRYANDGYVAAQNVQVKLYYPVYVIPLHASTPWASKRDSLITFDIGTLQAGQSGIITLTDSVICGNEAIRGLTQCIKAVITPKNKQSPDSRWDQSDLELKATCKENGLVRLTILNTGLGNMADSSAYRLFLDARIIFQSKFKLNSLDSLVLQVPVNGKTIRLEADLTSYYPDSKRKPSITLEGCGTAKDIVISKGFVNQLPADDATEEVAFSCLPILDSYDPNDKLASPQGVGGNHLITANDGIEYLIRFQNTGTDLAYNITIQDTLDEHLDLSTLQIGAASHAFSWKLSGNGKPVIIWTFKNINLPDHKTNEPASHGYVRFRIAQKAGNSIGTEIVNQAAIIFDYNSPIITNVVTHQIGEIPVNQLEKVQVDICINNYPTLAQAGADQVIHERSSVDLSGNRPLNGRGKWILIRGKGIFEDTMNPQTMVTDLGVGKNIFEWTITMCDSISRSRVTIERVVIPPAPIAVSPAAICPGIALPLLSAIGNQLCWYADKQLQHLLYQGSTYQPTINSTTTFYVTQRVHGYESNSTVVNLVIKPLPNAPLILPAPSYCAGEIIQPLVANGSNIRWYTDTALSQEVANGNTFQPVIDNTTQYYATQTVDGCESKAAHISITIKPRPSAPIIQSVDKLYCEGETIDPVTAIGDNIRWYNDQERKQLVATGKSFQPTITTTSSFYATQTIDDCEGVIQMVEVHVQPASITLQTSGDTLIAPLAEGYQWYFEGVLLPKAANQKFVAKNTGNYMVILQNKQCTSVSQVLYHTITITSSSIKLSPNPALTVIYLEFISGETGEVVLLVHNQLGQIVKQLTVYKKYNQLEHALAISDLTQGMYIIEASTSKQRMKAKFIKL